jgi:hypothetical protein
MSERSEPTGPVEPPWQERCGLATLFIAALNSVCVGLDVAGVLPNVLSARRALELVKFGHATEGGLFVAFLLASSLIGTLCAIVAMRRPAWHPYLSSVGLLVNGLYLLASAVIAAVLLVPW